MVRATVSLALMFEASSCGASIGTVWRLVPTYAKSILTNGFPTKASSLRLNNAANLPIWFLLAAEKGWAWRAWTRPGFLSMEGICGFGGRTNKDFGIVSGSRWKTISRTSFPGFLKPGGGGGRWESGALPSRVYGGDGPQGAWLRSWAGSAFSFCCLEPAERGRFHGAAVTWWCSADRSHATSPYRAAPAHDFSRIGFVD